MGFWSGIGSKAAKIASSPLVQTAFVGLSMKNLIGDGYESAYNFGQGVATGDPNTFQTAGYGAAHTLSNMGYLGVDAYWLTHILRTRNGTEAWETKENATIFAKHGDMLNPVGGKNFKQVKSWPVGSETGEQIMRTGKSGSWVKRPGGNKFIKNLSMGKIAVSMAAPILTDLVGGAVVGFAGHLIDAAWQENRAQRSIQYDSRFIDSSRYDMSTYEQTGVAMQNLQNRMVSVSRAVHSRG